MIPIDINQAAEFSGGKLIGENVCEIKFHLCGDRKIKHRFRFYEIRRNRCFVIGTYKGPIRSTNLSSDLIGGSFPRVKRIQFQ